MTSSMAMLTDPHLLSLLTGSRTGPSSAAHVHGDMGAAWLRAGGDRCAQTCGPVSPPRAVYLSPQACRPPTRLTHIFPIGPWNTVSSSVSSTHFEATAAGHQ